MSKWILGIQPSFSPLKGVARNRGGRGAEFNLRWGSKGGEERPWQAQSGITVQTIERYGNNLRNDCKDKIVLISFHANSLFHNKSVKSELKDPIKTDSSILSWSGNAECLIESNLRLIRYLFLNDYNRFIYLKIPLSPGRRRKVSSEWPGWTTIDS